MSKIIVWSKNKIWTIKYANILGIYVLYFQPTLYGFSTISKIKLNEPLLKQISLLPQPISIIVKIKALFKYFSCRNSYLNAV